MVAVFAAAGWWASSHLISTITHRLEPAGTPTATAPAPPAPAAVATGLHLPAHLLGFPKNSSSEARGVVSQLSSSMRGNGEMHAPKAAVYGNMSASSVLVFGATWTKTAAQAAASDPVRVGTGFTQAFMKAGGTTGVRSFPAGPHGGALNCGDKTLAGTPTIICAWADTTGGGGAFYLRGSASSLNDAAAKTLQIRAVIER